MDLNVANLGGGTPATLTSPALGRRLADLCGEERNVLVDFLLHLDEFDRRRAWAEAGYGSLWVYSLEVLHLREGAAWRRIEAMKLLRRFPSVEPALRDGRLCLTTLNLLGPVLDGENVSGLVGRAAFLSKADTERLVVSIRPRVAPKDGVRRVSSGAVSTRAATASELPAVRCPGPDVLALAPSSDAPLASAAPPCAPLAVPAPVPVAGPELRPVSADTYSLRVTIDSACKAELDQLVSLLSHKTGGDLAAVLREAIRCGISTHGKRRGAVEPERKRGGQAARAEKASKSAEGGDRSARPPAPSAVATAPDPRAIPIEVRRQVWKRDDACCAWTSHDGKRCGSRWKVQFGHVTPVALGGKSTVDNVRLECERHNQLEAIRVFGREHMAPYLGESAFSGESGRSGSGAMSGRTGDGAGYALGP